MIFYTKKLVAIVMIVAGLTPIRAQVQQRSSQPNDRQANALLRRIDNQSRVFQQSLNTALDNSRFDTTRREEEISRYVRDFSTSTGQLLSDYRNRQDVNTDVSEVLNRASYINNFMRRERLDLRAQNDWSALRSQLDQLAAAWQIKWNWNNSGVYPNNNNSSRNNQYGNNRLTGTWRLNSSRSDNARTVAERALGNDQSVNNNTALANLIRRLEAPDALALDRRGQTITLASTRAQQVSFDADGRESTESLRNGRQRSTRSTLTGDRLVVRTTGDRGSDFEVTFEPIDGGRSLRVTRSLYTDRINQNIVAQSIYDRTAETAQFNVYNGATDYSEPRRNTQRGNYEIADGTQVIATLNNDLRTKDAQAGDTFSMVVRQPSQYEGAVIEGRVINTERSGRVSGRSGFQLQFDRIRFRDGRNAEFVGTIESVRLANGETVRVDQEGGVADDKSQTNRTVQRSAIGGAIGAIIGAIAGGGKGAAIGAVVGAGAGAGSVYVQGRDDLELTRGTELTIRANAPR